MQNVIPIKRGLNESIPDDLMTAANCAIKHSCSRSYIYKLYYSGKIKRYKQGQYKFSYNEVKKADRN